MLQYFDAAIVNALRRVIGGFGGIWVALKLSSILAPGMFAVHSALCFILLLDVAFLIVAKIILRPSMRRRR